MITIFRKIYHINQNVFEYWIHDSIVGWINVNQNYFDDIIPSNIEYVELHHDMSPNKENLFGPYIIC